jgi:hypothetical protein
MGSASTGEYVVADEDGASKEEKDAAQRAATDMATASAGDERAR